MSKTYLNENSYYNDPLHKDFPIYNSTLETFINVEDCVVCLTRKVFISVNLSAVSFKQEILQETPN